jgi:hypothetical protein
MFKNRPPAIPQQPFLLAFKGADGAITVQLDPAGVEQPAGVGILLVDLARHYARMFVQTGRAGSEEQALNEIRQLFDAEWNSPTDPGHGGIRN